LQWRLTSDVRGQKQTAYRILVASTPELLVQDRGDLWDSGKVPGEDTSQIAYAGCALISRQRCYWKVMAWDKSSAPSLWSPVASWSMGLLSANDWQAAWITDPILASPANRPIRPINCYQSELAPRPDAPKWIVLDLGTPQMMNNVNLLPARPVKRNADWRTVMFPRRFKIEVADQPDFKNARVLVDQTKADYDSPRTEDVLFKFEKTSARYVRVQITKLARWDAQDYGVALGGLTVNLDKQPLAVQAVSCSDSIESAEYSKSYLGKAARKVAISPDSPEVTVDYPDVPKSRTVSRVPLLRREFTLDGKIKAATLYVSARGFYEVRVNGRRVGDQLLSPGYTDYSKRIPYQSLDVTARLKPGANALGALLGYGWYAGHMNLADLRCIDGFFPQFIAQLEVTLANGRRVIVTTDDKWRSTLSGPVLWSDLLDGEGYECRKEMPGWDQAGFNDREWKPVWSQPRDEVALVSPGTPPVREIQDIAPVSVKEVKPGVYVYDFGQEISGYCRLKVDEPAGTRVRLRHSELVDKNGAINTKNLWGTAAQEDYVLDGRGPRTLTPHFTYHGFRYVELTGLTRPPAKDAVVAVHVRSALPTAGEFTSSNETYNRLMTAVRWTQWNMLFDVPAGCAGRSERLAWLGDIRPCVQTLFFNTDAAAFFSKYLVDIRDGQKEAGQFSDITPHNHLRETGIATGAPGWADAGVSLPWDVYVQLGDRRLLEDHFDAAKRWIEYVRERNPNLLFKNGRGNNWGDWLPAGSPATHKDAGSTAFFAYSTELVARMARILGRSADAARYEQLHAEICRAFAQAYVSPEGKIGNDSQGDYTLALQFHLLDEPARTQAIIHLKAAIARADDHVTVGFWSCELPRVLSEAGQHALAEKIVLQPTRHSWRFIVENSTTFWESFNADQRNLSLNHWTYSSIGEWLWRNVAGLNPDSDSPGYRAFIVRPRPSAEVSSCQATHQSIRGPITINWAKSEISFSLDLTVPVGATAELYLPATNQAAVSESGRPANAATGVAFLRQEGPESVFQVQSGQYRFTVRP
jgi:alpha-L-rhamnosidase